MKRNSPTATSPPGPDISALEARVMMSAAPLPADVAIVEPETNDAAPLDAGNQEADAAGDGEFIFSDSEFAASTSEENTNDAGSDEFIYSDDTANLTTAQPELDVHQVTVTAPVLPADFGEIDSEADLRQELVFVDAGIEDLNQLLKDLWANDDPTREIEVVLISSGSDGLERITSTLAARSGLDAIHIVSHGSDGQVQLGNTSLTSENFGLYQEQIAAWGNSLNTGAELLLYGCDLAGTATGRDLINAIGAACNCDVAASNDLTGAAELGGDWDLEYSTGEIETSIAFSSALQVSWQGTLDITSNLVAHYEFEEGSGSTVDDQTANNNDGNISGSATWTTGEIGQALEFDPSNGEDYVEIPNSATLENVQENDYTLAAWFRPDSTPPGSGSDNDANYGVFIKAGWHDGIYFNSDNRFLVDHQFSDGTSVTLSSANTFATGQFHHVVAIIDRTAGTAELYVNGQLEDSDTFTAGKAAREYGTQTWKLGIANPGGGDWGWPAHGAIDDARIYDRAISGADVTELYDLGANSWPTATNDVYATNAAGATVNVLTNDTDSDGGTLQVIDYTSVSNGVLVDNGAGSFSYTPDSGYLGADSFDYMIDDGQTDLAHFYGLAGNGDDSVGGNDASSITGTTTVAGSFGDALYFDEVDDHVVVSDFDYNSEFTVSFDFKLDDNSGTGLQYVYSHGTAGAVNSLNIFIAEASQGTLPNQMVTTFLDSNDTVVQPVFDISGIVGDGQWHNYTLTVDAANGAQIYLNGVLQASAASVGGDSFNPGTDLYLGGREDLDSTRFFGGGLDSVRIYDRALESSEVTSLADQDSYTATATFNVSPNEGVYATSSTGGGLNINDDGGNDIYLVADESPFSGQTATTIEVEFSSDSPATDVTTLFSYADPTNQDELFLGVDAGGELFFRTSEDGGAGYGSITHAPQLFDGETHTVAVTWENATGILKFYVDGEELGIGRNSYQTGTTIDAGGAVVFGQRQGAPESAFDANDTFSGTIYNVRVFDHVRTDEQLAASYQSDLPFDENGMLAQWVFDNLSTGGVVTETVSGNNLTLKHTSEGGFSSSEAELTFTLNENALDGAVVGVVTGVDAEREAQIAALLDADPNLVYSAETGKFYKAVSSSVDWNVASTSALSTTLNGVNGQLAAIRSATEQQIAGDIVASAGYELWLGATDQTVEGEHRWTQDGADADQFWSGDETGESVDGAYSNWLAGRPDNSGGNQNYVFIRTDGFWNEEILSYSTGGYLVEWDADEVLDATDALTYSISNQSLAGAFEIDADSGELRVADGSLLDADTLATHTITVRTADVDSNTYDQAFSVSLNNLADANQTVPGPQSVNEDTVLTFTGANAVSVSDSIAGTDAPMQVTLSVNNGVLNLSTLTGITIVDGADGSSLMTFNGDESAINAALDGLTFTPVSNYNGSVTLKMTTSLEADQEGFYNFEGGNANDQNVGTSHDGVFNGDAATTMDADRGEVLTLDGAGDFVQINSTFGSPSSVTIGGWVNFTGTGRQEFISLDDRFHIALDDGGKGVKGSFQTGPGTFNDLESNVYLADTGWRHVAYTYDDAAATHSLYIDGELVASESVVNPIDWAGATTTYIGQHPGGINYLNGSVDDARIFSRALSANEIAAMAGEQFEVTGDVAITVNAVNDQPVFNNLDGNPTFVEGGPAVVLDDDVTFFDIDIDRGEDVYTNIDLTLSRNGGANAEDVFSATGNLIFQGNNDLELSGVVVGTVVSNSGGTLNLRFNGAANEANVNEVLQSIAYSNSSDTPPASVTIDWSMEDSNGTAQGSGGNLFATGSTTVDIVDSPENAVITVPIGQAVDEDAILTFSSAGGNAITVDSGSGFDPVVTTTLSVGNGTLTLSGVTGITFLDGTSNGGATLTIAGKQTDINNALDGLQYQGGLNYNGSDTLTVTTGTDAAIEANLHAHYEFLNGSLEDETANGYDGAASGDPALTSDAERGDVLTFDGNDRVDVANSVSTLGDQVTIAAWVNLDAGQQDNIFLSIGDEFYVILDNSNPSLSMGLHVNGFTTNSLSSTHNIAGEGWNHVAATFNDVTKETHLYLNGELVRMSTFAFSDVDWSMADSPNITIGSLSDGSNAFTGSLDDVRVYNSELSESDIIAVMGDNGFDTESVSVTVNAVNDTPGVAGPGSAYNVNERTNLPIEGTGFTVSDIDAASGVATATFEVGEGTITIVEGDSGITITAGNGSDTVTFTGTVAEIDALLRGSSTGTITYYNGSFTPSASTTITLTVNDGGNTGSDPGLTADAASEEDAASQTININALNSEPVIANLGGDTLSYTEGDGQQAIDQAAGAVVTDIDSSDFDTGTLTVSFNAGSDGAEDLLSVINTGTGVSQIGVSGSNITYEGVTIGAFTGGASGVDLVVTLNANADADAISALIRNISYENTDTTNPTTTDRTVRFVLTDGDGGVSTNYDTTIEVASNNQAPLVSLANTTTTISEDTDTSSAIKVADIVISDDGEGVNSLSLTGADAALFEIFGTELRLVAGASLDFETNSTLDVTVQVDDAAVGGSPDDTAPLAITVTDANEAPTVSLANTTTTIAEDTDTSSAIKVADIVVNDDALGTNTLSLMGADAALFEIVGTELRLVAGASLDFETNGTLDVTVQVDDAAVGGSPDDTAPLAITVTDANEAPTVSLANTTTTIAEDTDTSSAIKVADIVINDDALGTNTLSLTGADAALFEIVGTELRLVAGASLDFETNSTLDVTVQVDDAAVGGSPDDTAPLAITLTDANEAPTVSLANTTTTIAEDTDTSSAIKVADIVVNDDALGTNTLSLTGADAALFEIVGTELRLVAGASLDFETNSTLDVTVQVDDAAVGGSPDDTAPLAITVTDANEAPTVSLANTTTTISEDTDTSSAIKVADIVVNDDAIGTNTLSLTGADAALFEIVGTELRFVAGASLDFETNGTLDVTVQVDDAAVGGSPDDTAPLAITVTDANEAPTVSLANTTTTIAEDTDTSSAIKVADIVVNDDAIGTNTLSLTGADAALFEIVGTELRLVAGASLDFETNSTLDVTVQVDDAAVGDSPDDTAPLAIAVTDANEAPTVSLANTTTTIAEDADTSSATKVADIVVNDDALGTNTLSLTGADAALFEIVGTELRLVAGASLDFETNNTLDVTVQVNDAAVGGSPDDTAPLAISVTNVNEAPVNSTPGAQVVAEDGSLTFSSADGTAITVSDVDASSLQVTLTAANGRLTLGGTTGLTFSVGDGSDDATIEFTGTKADINAALEGLIFAPDGDYNGAASLQIVTSDLGASGTGGVLTDSDTIAINVTAQNDAPQLAAPAADSTPEDTMLVFSTAGGNAISVSDVDAAGSPLTLNLSVANGALTLASTAGLTFSGGDGSADAAMTFTGDAASINAALDGLMFTPSQDFHGNVALNMMLSDNGNTGAGGTLMAAGSVSVTVTPVNDAPTGQSSSFTGSQNQTLSTSVPGVLTGASDVDGDALTAVLVSAPSSGSLSLNADGSFTYDPAFQFTGTVTFSFRVSDGADNSAVHTVQLVIEPAVAPPPPPTTPVDPVEPDPETPEDTTEDSSNETDDSSADEDENAGDESVDQPLAGVRGERGGTGFFSIGEEQPSQNEASDSLETVHVALLDSRNSGGDRTSPTALRAGGGYRDSGVGEFTVDGLDDYQRAQEAMTQPEFQKKLDSMRDEVFLTRNVSLGTATAVTSVASIGYLIWTVRGGYLLASMVSALPAWRMIDPVAVLNDIGPSKQAGENEESLQSMVKEHAGEEG